MKRKAAAFKQVIPPILVICCLVMVLAYQNCGPQKMLVTKLAVSSLCDTDPSRTDCTQVEVPVTSTPPPIDPGTLGTCNDNYGWCVRFFNAADPNQNPAPSPVAQFPIARQSGTQPAVELNYDFANGIPGAVPLGVTSDSWSMTAQVWWIPATQGNLRFTIEYSGTVTYSYSVLNALGQVVTPITIEQNSYNGTSPTYTTRNVDLSVNLPNQPPGYHLLKIVWQHSGTLPAHLRIVTPSLPGSSPTPTPSGTPGVTPTPTPAATPHILAGKIIWNISRYDAVGSTPAVDVNPRCPNGLVEVGALHTSKLVDSKLAGTEVTAKGWISLCAPSINEAKIVVGTSLNPTCGNDAANYDRLFSAKVNSTSPSLIVRGVDANGVAVTGSFTTYYSVCINKALNTPLPAPGGRMMLPVPISYSPPVGQAVPLEATCPPNYFLAGAYDLSTPGHFMAGQLYSSDSDPGQPANVIAGPNPPARLGFCLRQDMTSIAELASLSNTKIGTAQSTTRRITWPTPSQRSQLDMKVVIFSRDIGGRINPPLTVTDGMNQVNYTGADCSSFEARVVSCYKTGQPSQGCFISNKVTSWTNFTCLCDDSCGTCGPGNLLCAQ